MARIKRYNSETQSWEYADTSFGVKGDTGDSVTIASIFESAVDGGSNIVSFSDGTTLTIKNGTKGTAGTNGKTPVKGTDYFTAAEKTAIVNEVIAALPVYSGSVS